MSYFSHYTSSFSVNTSTRGVGTSAATLAALARTISGVPELLESSSCHLGQAPARLTDFCTLSSWSTTAMNLSRLPTLRAHIVSRCRASPRGCKIPDARVRPSLRGTRPSQTAHGRHEHAHCRSAPYSTLLAYQVTWMHLVIALRAGPRRSGLVLNGSACPGASSEHDATRRIFFRRRYGRH